MQPFQMSSPALRVPREPEGSCPGPRRTTQAASFRESARRCAFRRKFRPARSSATARSGGSLRTGDAHGVSIGKTLPAIASEPKTRYPKKAADGAERGRNSMWAGARKLRRALRAQLTHKKIQMSVFCRHLVFCDRFFNAASGQWASGADSGDGPGASVF